MNNCQNSEEDRNFITDTIKSIKRINTDHIESKENLEQIIQDFVCNMNEIWFKHLKIINITRHLKS